MSRRQWLAMAAGAAASGLLPLDLLGRPAAAAAPERPAGARLCLLLDAGDLDVPLRRGIDAIAARSSADTKAPLIDPVKEPARLDELVEQLQRWRSYILLGMLPAHKAFVVEEALRELGASWLSRGEHVQLAAGYSRHRLMSAASHSGQVEILRFAGAQHSDATRWAELLGRGMAMRALAPGSKDALLPLVALADPAAPGRRTSLAAAPAEPKRFVSFVTRV